MTTRRRFLGTAAGVTGAAIAATIDPNKAAAAQLPRETQATSAHSSAFTKANFTIELANQTQAGLKSADGGESIGQVVAFRNGNDPVANKFLGSVKTEEFHLLTPVSESLGLPWAQWIVDMPNFQGTKKNGAVVTSDFNFAVIRRREFHNALITEIKVPTLDGGSKDAGYLDIAVLPASASDGSPKGKTVAPTLTQPTKVWHTADFKLEIDGLDCTRVARIESFTIKQNVSESQFGEDRFPTLSPTTVEFPDLVVTFAAASLPSWQAWFDDFVVKGNNSDSNEKSGSITFLTPDLKTTLAVLNLHHIGIYRLDPDNEPDESDKLPRAQANLYVEQMNFTKLGPYALT